MIYFSFYLLFNLKCHQNNGTPLPPRLLLVKSPLHSPLCRGRCFWLIVVCCFADWWPSKATTYFLFYSFVTLFTAPKRYTNALSLACRSARLPSITPPLTLTLTFGWLLYLLTKWRPPKAKTLPPSLFFDGLHCNIPNKGTNSGAA